MNNYQTSDKLREMCLNAMAELHTQYMKTKENHNLTADEYLALLVDHEWEDRQNKKKIDCIKQPILDKKLP